MRRASLSLVVGLMVFLVACGSTPVTGLSPNDTSASTVSLSITDQPPNGVTVLFFQISLTAAYLTPASGSGNVSLLADNTPIEVDVTQLQAISAFLSTANAPTGVYNSLTLRFMSAQLVIFNASDASIASTCPLGTVCQLTPQIDDSSSALTFSSTPFPVTVSENMPLGFLVDFHLDEVIQSDLSVNLGIANGVTITQLPSTPPSGPPLFGFLSGTVQNVGSNQFMLQTNFGRIFTIDVNNSTTYEDFPSSVCSPVGFACLRSGEVVQVQVASLQAGGTLLAASISYIQSATQQLVQGDIVSLKTAADGNTVVTLLLRWAADSSTFPAGGIASVTVPTTATFSIDSGDFTIPGGLSFASASDLLLGQAVQVDVVTGTLSNSNSAGNGLLGFSSSVSFTTDSVELEPSQITGLITTINSSSFTLTTLPNFFAHWPNSNWAPMQITVQTTSQTTFQGFSPDNFSGLTTGLASVRGWLFSTPSGATPSTQVAETVRARANGFF